MTQERGIVCMFCGEGFGYAGDNPDDETMKAAVDHEKVCPQNPYLAEIADLKEKYRIAVIHASEYKTWVEKAEAENAQVYKTLGRMCELSDIVCSWVDKQNSVYTPDTVRTATKEIMQYVEQVRP